MPVLREIEAVGVHHLGPRRHEVLHELLLRVRARIDFREGAKLRVRAEDQVDARAGPLDRFGLAVAALVHAIGARGLPLRAHVEQVDEEVVGQLARRLGEDAVLRAAGIGAEHAQAADQHGHLRRRQRSNCARSTSASSGAMNCCLPLMIVAEAVGTRLERREGLDVGLLLRRVHAARREGNLHVDAGILRGLFDRRAAAENDQVGERNLLAELLLDRFELRQHLRELGRIVHLPILLRG